MNRMDSVLNKIERRLGVKMLNLPEALAKDKWASEVIANETLDTFSRYYPHALTYVLNTTTPMVDGYYLIDEDVCDSTEIIGVKDIDWELFSQIGSYQSGSFGSYGSFQSFQYGIDDIALAQGRSDISSMFNNQIIVEFKEPNMIKIENVIGSNLNPMMKEIPITLLVKHPINLMTISQTMMEVFEDLAQADVAIFLYENLKYFDGLETVFANVDLKLSDMEAKATSKRDEVVQKLDDTHVSFANKNQPMILTV